MTPSEQNIAIAEWMGWRKGQHGFWELDGRMERNGRLLPDFYSDLNAIHSAVGLLSDEDSQWKYIDVLGSITGARWTDQDIETFKIAQATAAQRCEALLKTLSLWRKQ